MKRVCVIGMGWLGEQTAHFLKNKGIQISGSTTSLEKVERFQTQFKQVFIYSLGEKEFEGTLELDKMDYFLITIPPSSLGLNYATELSKLIRKLNFLNPRATFIYTSSTSVYGTEVREIDERSICKPITQSAKQIVEFENDLLTSFKKQSIIIRLAGLCGRGRHPVHTLSKKDGIAKPNAGVNLLHATDAIRFIDLVIEKDLKQGLFNLCSGEHPSKRKYYQWAAKQLKLRVPQFDEQDESIDKTILCNSIRILDFQLKYNNPFEYPELN